MVKIDDLDLTILSELSADANISVPRLSKKINANSSVVYSRIKRLVKNKLIERFTIVVNDRELGYGVKSLTGINMDSKQRDNVIDPGAFNIPWATAVNDADGTFKALDELQKIYQPKGVTPDKDVICYCRIGERSSHTWFVLKYLLGYPKVRNYDGSWTEWGNMIGNPIAK